MAISKLKHVNFLYLYFSFNLIKVQAERFLEFSKKFTSMFA